MQIILTANMLYFQKMYVAKKIARISNVKILFQASDKKTWRKGKSLKNSQNAW